MIYGLPIGSLKGEFAFKICETLSEFFPQLIVSL